MERDQALALSYSVYLDLSQRINNAHLARSYSVNQIRTLKDAIVKGEHSIPLLVSTHKELKNKLTLSLNDKDNLVPIRIVGPIAERMEEISRVTLARVLGIVVLAIMSGCLAVYIVEGISITRRRRSKT